jgi:3-hydroxybutyryl-CoA dehydrogenase
VREALALVAELELFSIAQTEAAVHRMSFGSECVDCDLVVESVPEDLELKADLLSRAAEAAPKAILASNTSSLSIGTLGDAVGAPGRTLGTHYWNPPLLMPLVELVAGERTAPERLELVEATLRALGKRPVRVRDVPGFVWNRLQLALLREALWIVGNEVATPETVDEIVRRGLARRWRLTGPFETVALGGPETFERVAANLFPVLSDAETAEGLSRWVDPGAPGLRELRARRDGELAEELRRDRPKEA